MWIGLNILGTRGFAEMPNKINFICSVRSGSSQTICWSQLLTGLYQEQRRGGGVIWFEGEKCCLSMRRYEGNMWR